MQVTRDIVRDLLPVYLAGEASPDTRAVVESYLAEDSTLREIVEAANTYSPPPVEVPVSLEARSLERTRRLLGRKNFWLGFGLIFSFAPLRITPWWLADLVMLAGLGGWVMFVLACKELNATGLEPARRWSLRLLWGGIGYGLGQAAGHLIQQQTGAHQAIFLGPLTLGLALWIGEKLHQIPTYSELNRPTTLFGK